MAIQAFSSVHVVDLSDIGNLTMYLTSSLPTSQIYNPNEQTFNPDWTVNNCIITPVITYNGANLQLNATGLSISFTRKAGVNSATALSSGESVSGGILTVNANKLFDASGNQITYICTVTYTDPATNTPLTAVSSLSYSMLVTSVEVKHIEITGENAFLYNSERRIVGSNTITLTADYSGVSIIQWQYKRSDGTFAAFPTTNNPLINGNSLIVKEDEDNIWIDGKVAVIKVTTNDQDVYDIAQIVKIWDGSSGDATVSAILTNENYTLVEKSDGTLDYLSNCNTTIQLYEGGDDVTSQYTITVSASTGVTYNYDQSTHTCQITNVTQSNSYVDFECTRTGYSTIHKRFYISVVQAGQDGKNAITYEVVPSSLAINISESGVLTPSSISINSWSKEPGINNGVVLRAYSGRFVISESVDRSTFTTRYTSQSDESVISYTPTSTDVNIIKCELYAAGGTTTLLDSQTVITTRDGATGEDGADGLSMGLGNYSDVIPCDKNGNVLAARTLVIPFYSYKGIRRTPVTCSVGTLPTGMTVQSNIAGTVVNDGLLSLAIAAGATLGNSSTNTGDITITLSADGKSSALTYSWTKSKQAENAVLLQLYSEDGGVINETKTQTVVKLQMTYGSQNVTPSSIVWAKLVSGSYQTIPNQTSSQITITESMVADELILRCTATYEGVNYNAYYTVNDMTDIDAQTIATISQFKNRVGLGAVYTVLYSGGVEVDPLPTKIFSDVAPTSPQSGDYYYKLNATNKTCVLMKYENGVWTQGTENFKYQYNYYRLDNKGEPLDATPWKTTRCFYIDATMFDDRMTFLCEVIKS